MTKDGKQIFSFGHAEYDRMTLDQEYKRDINKGMSVPLPKNYYPDDDPTNQPKLTWRAHCNNLYSNWLNYYVYQNTPYMWGQMLDKEKLKNAQNMLTDKVE